MLKGEYGSLPGKVSEEARAKAGIKPEDVITCRPADLLEPEFEKYKKEYADVVRSDEDVLSVALFPQVAPKFLASRNVRCVPKREIKAVSAFKQARKVAGISRKAK